MSEIVAATAAELLEGVAAAPGQAAGQSIEQWLQDAQMIRQLQEMGNPQPVYKWNYDPAADEAFSKIVDETSADGAWQAWKDSGGNVSPNGSASPSPTVKASPQTAIKKPAAAGASAGGLLTMSLPTWTAAVAPLLGVAVGAGLYELSPELWEKISRTLLPFCYEGTDTLPVITDEDGNTYLDKEAAEAIKRLFEEEGIIGSGGKTDPEVLPDVTAFPTNYIELTNTANRVLKYTITGATGALLKNGTAWIFLLSGAVGTAYTVTTQFDDGPVYTSSGTLTGNTFTYNGQTSAEITAGGYADWNVTNSIPNVPFTDVTSLSGEEVKKVAWILNYGQGVTPEIPEGMSRWGGTAVDFDNLPITKVFTDPTDSTKTRDFIPVALPTQPGVSVDSDDNPDPTTNADPEKQIDPYIWPAIPKEQFPDGSKTEDTQNLDDSAPIPLPVPSPKPKPNPEDNPSDPPEDKPGQLVDVIPPIDIGGNIPYPAMPEGGSDPQGADGGVGGLVSVYNPTYSELTAFSQWLWVTYADATIDKIWNNPFDGIISLHELYATPNKGGRKYIKSGFLVSPVDSITVPDRYSEIECGSAIVPEHYGNYLDYSPYSKALCYLPFIGIVELNVDDIVGHAINIKYRVDSYSGACIAIIECAKEGASAILYQFTGNCSVQMPIAGGTQASIKAAQLSAGAYQNAYHIAGVTGLIGGIASGAAQVIGGLASMAASPLGQGGIGSIGSGVASVIQGAGQKMTQEAFGNAAAVSQTVSAKSSVQHSGQFGESFGAMGAKRPYLIIKRPVQVVVPNYQNEYGYPAHKYVTIGECTGYLRCRGVHVNSARATDAECQLIEQQLMGGVFVT